MNAKQRRAERRNGKKRQQRAEMVLHRIRHIVRLERDGRRPAADALATIENLLMRYFAAQTDIGKT